MKQFVLVGLLIGLMILSGCSTAAQTASEEANYKNYLAQVNAANAAKAANNLVDIEFAYSEDGTMLGIKKLNVSQPYEPIVPHMYAHQYHPAWGIFGGIATAAINVSPMILTPLAYGKAFKDVLNATSGAVTTYNNSNNKTGDTITSGDVAGDTISSGDVSGDTAGADLYAAGNDLSNTTSANVDNSTTAGNDYAGNDYYPDTSDNSTITTAAATP